MSSSLKKKLDEVELDSKSILIRVDYNVPFMGHVILDNFRIQSSIKTLLHCLSKNPKCIFLISHLGRPKGNVVKELSFRNIITQIGEVFNTSNLDCNFGIADLPLSEEIDKEKIISEAEYVEGKKDESKVPLILLENIRFYPEEESKEINSEEVISFRKKLSSLADVFVFDAFGCCHRNHSSVAGVNCEEKVMGMLVQKELESLDLVLKTEKKDLGIILGGSKVEDKVQLIKSLVEKSSVVCIGGAMANTFLYHTKERAESESLGDSLVFTDARNRVYIDEIMEHAKKFSTEIILPLDFMTSKDNVYDNEEVFEKIEKDESIMDIGPKSVEFFLESLLQKSCIFWNGPLGKFEEEKFSHGTKKLFNAIKDNESKIFIGGGDTSSALKSVSHKENVYISSGGGACLELIQGKSLPGVESLSKR